MNKKLPLHIHLSTLVTVVSLLVGSVIAVFAYRISRDMLESSAANLTELVSRDVLSELEGVVKPANLLINVLQHDSFMQANDLEARWQRLGLFREMLDQSSGFSAFFVAYGQGDFFLMRALRADSERSLFNAPEGTHFLVQSIDSAKEKAAPQGRYLFLNERLELLREDDRPDYAARYHPQDRTWYRMSIVADQSVMTPPYLFFADQKVGLTLARRMSHGEGVVGADISLEALNTVLARHITASTRLALVNAQGKVIAHPHSQAATGTVLMDSLDSLGLPSFDFAHLGERSFARELEIEGQSWQVLVKALRLERTDPLYLVMAFPSQELFASAHKLRSSAIEITLMIIVLAIPVIWLVARVISRSLRQLARETEAIRRFEFAQPIAMRSWISEVDALAQTLDITKSTIRRFLDITQAVAGEENFEHLLPMLLREMQQAARAEAGVLYLVNQDWLQPVSALMANGQKVEQGLEVLPLEGGSFLLQQALAQQKTKQGMLSMLEQERAGLSSLQAQVQAPYAVAIPLFSRRKNLLGVVILLRTTLIDAAELNFISVLAGTVSSSLETREFIQAQKDLFEAFIQVIAGAIDAKSPYTGGHCARVPELAKLLAQAACDAQSGPFRNFSLGEDEWETLHIASWLHDCGKVTTPDFVIDKATKLETRYNRIHEIRTRFEVLKRDAEIECLTAILAGRSVSEARAEMIQKQRQLDEDFSFVAQCNEGVEHMQEEHLERLKQIAGYTWWRTLDDRLGLSQEEQLSRKEPAQPLPVQEQLLADKAEHRLEYGSQERINPDNPWGFRMRVPDLAYNLGELYNLSIKRGTLSTEERYKINEHMVHTVIMLSQLPFPKHLKQVPEIASGHHEKLDGTGYPKALQRNELSVMARMLAIADIFEALTAADRPYKKGKPLSETLHIMSNMVRNHALDPELFELFLESGVYLQYAQRFMNAEQMDVTDVRPYLGARPA